MKAARKLELKVVRIGNSRGVRLPKELLAKYLIRDTVIVEEHDNALVLRSKNDKRLSWDETYEQMARAREDWSDLDAVVADGLDKEPW
jgi:antitoxin MazE